jgi:hypothetical protein
LLLVLVLVLLAAAAAAGAAGTRLKAVSASQGLMLEGVSPALAALGGPHWGCPDKEPAARLATIEAAGKARVPFTSGVEVIRGGQQAQQQQQQQQQQQRQQQQRLDASARAVPECVMHACSSGAAAVVLHSHHPPHPCSASTQ